MTFRARPTTSSRRSGHEADHRRNIWLNIGFGLVVVVAVLLLAGVVGANWYSDHLAPAAKVNGATITMDDLRARETVENFRIGQLVIQTQASMTSGHISANTGSQILSYLQQQQQSLAQVALSQAINTELLLQLGAKRGITVTDAQVDAQVLKDATTPESRHVFMISIAPETSSGADTPTDAQVAAAQTKADGLLAQLKSGATWESVVKASGDTTAAQTNGDILFVNKDATSPDRAFVDAVSALSAAGYTPVVKGSDGTFRIGRVTEIAPAKVDTNYQQELANASIDTATYRKVARAVVVRDAIEQQLIAEVVDKPSQMRQVQELQLDANNGQDVPAGSILVRHILFSPNGSSSAAASLKPDDPAWTKAQADAGAAYAALKAGTATWADELKQSDDTGSVTTNGFIGYSDPTSGLDPAFAAAIFKTGLQPGELLPPVKSQFGWHVIQFVSADGPVARAQKLASQAAAPGTDFTKLVADQSDASNAGTGGNLGWVARYQLDKAQEDAIFALQAGQTSQPISATDASGTQIGFIYKVTAVQDRSPDPAQADSLRSNAFINWYQGVYNDTTQTTIEMLYTPPASGA